MKLSARNVIPGKLEHIHKGAVTATLSSPSSLSDLKPPAAWSKVKQVILAAFGALGDEQLPHD
jgi:hypothetical protein